MIQPRTETETAGAALLSGWVSRKDLADALCVTVDTLGRWEARRFGPPLACALGAWCFIAAGSCRTEWLGRKCPGPKWLESGNEPSPVLPARHPDLWHQ